MTQPAAADPVRTRAARAKSLLNVGRWREAAEELHALLALEPQHYWALMVLIPCYRHLGRLDDALAVARKAIAAGPDRPEAYYQLSLAQLDKRRPATALKYARKAIEIDPDWSLAWQAASLCHLELKEWEKAIEHAQEDLKRAPESTSPRVNLSFAYHALGDHQAAEQWARRALELDPSDAAALNNLALCLEKQGRWQEAVDLFSGALAAEPTSDLLRQNLVGASRGYIDHRDVYAKADGTPMSHAEREFLDIAVGLGVIFGAIAAVIPCVLFTETSAGAMLVYCGIMFFVGLPLLFLGVHLSRRRARKRLPPQAQLALAHARRRKPAPPSSRPDDILYTN